MLNLEQLRKIHEAHASDFQMEVQDFVLRGKSFSFRSRPHFMGVINLSSDSWYRESVCLSCEAAIERGVRLHAEGADLIDIGAESTLANAAVLNPEVQNSALLPVVEALSSRGILVSVETYHPEVTEACLKAGAAVLNLTGNVNASEMYRMVADYDAGVIICYVQGANVRNVRDFELSDDHTQILLEYFKGQVDQAVRCGVKRIWIDPGLGFYYRNLQDSAQRIRYQMNTFLNTFRLRKLGWPTCHALPHAFEYFQDEVRSAEPFFGVLALLGKTDLLRTHELSKVRAVAKTMQIF